MISYVNVTTPIPKPVTSDNEHELQQAVWIDLLNPTKEDEELIAKNLHLILPKQHEMQEIEFSSRLYKENGSLFMTVTMVAKSESAEPKTDAVTLILAQNKLFTVRYIEPQSFALFISRLSKLPTQSYQASLLMIELLDASIDRLADILEKVSHHLDEYSKLIFGTGIDDKSTHKLNYRLLLQAIGKSGDLSTKVQESLLSFNRLISFFEQNNPTLDNSSKGQLATLTKDINSISDYVDFLSNKVNFLLDATLGMVNIEQNSIIKIFSIAAVILLPPTLVASIYGMNFKFIPELSWHYGYPFAISLMVISAWLPYKFFKRKNWL